MPQMAPMNWLMMLLLTSMFMLMLFTSTYFSFNYQPKIKLKHIKIMKNWKW